MLPQRRACVDARSGESGEDEQGEPPNAQPFSAVDALFAISFTAGRWVLRCPTHQKSRTPTQTTATPDGSDDGALHDDGSTVKLLFEAPGPAGLCNARRGDWHYDGALADRSGSVCFRRLGSKVSQVKEATENTSSAASNPADGQY